MLILATTTTFTPRVGSVPALVTTYHLVVNSLFHHISLAMTFITLVTKGAYVSILDSMRADVYTWS